MTTSPAQYQLAVIVGSVRPGRFAPVIANWFVAHAKQRGELVLDIIDLADSPDEFTTRVGAADAVVVITPEYNHAYPGPLKTAIDTVGREWHAKPVGFVSYGGISGGLRAVEQLRQVFAELHAVTIRETVSFHNAGGCFDADGRPLESEAVETAATALLDQLGWWAEALRTARAVRPYGW
ncbi:NADPH-dependent FMN reductase [Amycolatopsis sp. H20-H5]|uniref:NADPH-dependent FMN reductase n=1 Tax=Amycolatopsis sp. H20-H5 TaxID=3046309 RepID=UPI002DBC8FA2|nr:NAD(P)H-dependent oxidoreductase [Amycolatopsis sp. H20-H5]MEC3979358.1 NAD(P)H-dependent oxidoreductase [Amycolatopsis sp. H20-H5]